MIEFFRKLFRGEELEYEVNVSLGPLDLLFIAVILGLLIYAILTF
mgnify:CR=1 FL=1